MAGGPKGKGIGSGLGGMALGGAAGGVAPPAASKWPHGWAGQRLFKGRDIWLQVAHAKEDGTKNTGHSIFGKGRQAGRHKWDQGMEKWVEAQT